MRWNLVDGLVAFGFILPYALQAQAPASRPSFLDKLPKVECETQTYGAASDENAPRLSISVEGSAGFARFESGKAPTAGSPGSGLDYVREEYLVRKVPMAGGALAFVDVESYSSKLFIRINPRHPAAGDLKSYGNYVVYTRRTNRTLNGSVTCTVAPEVLTVEKAPPPPIEIKTEFICRTPRLLTPWQTPLPEHSLFQLSVGLGPKGVPMARLATSIGPSFRSGSGTGHETELKVFELESLTPVMTDGYVTFKDKKTLGEEFQMAARPGGPLSRENSREGDPGAGMAYFFAKYKEELPEAERDFRLRLVREHLTSTTFEDRQLKSDLRCYSLNALE